MAVFDTPITTNEQNLQKVLAQKLPVAVYLYNTRQKPLDDMLAQLAKNNVGKLLIARVDVVENPHVHDQFGHPSLPALVTMSAVHSSPGRSGFNRRTYVNTLITS